MAEKQTKLSIVIRAVDQATAKIKAINDRLDAVTKPIRDFKEQVADLREKSGLDDVIGGFKGVGSAIAGILTKIAAVGGVVGVAVAGLFHLVDSFDDLGDKAEELGVSVDFLAQMRFAAEKSGASVEQLDSGLKGFVTSLGQARAGTGRMASFLKKVSPALYQQVRAAKSNEQAFDLMADAMAKVADPAKRAALAQKTLGDASLAPLLARGSKGIKDLRARYLELAGSQEGAAGEAGKVDDAMKELKASTDGIKAALVEGLAPALKVIVEQLRDWLKGHRGDIKEWAAQLGKRIPDAFNALVGAVKKVIDFIRPFVDSATKLKIIAVAIAGVIAGPLITAVYGLGVALLTTPVGWIVAGIAAIAAGAYLLIDNWDAVSGFFTDLWDTLGEKFGIARDIVAAVLAPFIYIPAKIIANWESIVGFFAGLWDGVVSVFRKAWDIIKGITDSIVEAVDFVSKKVDEFIHGTEEGRAKTFDMLTGGAKLTPEQQAMRDRFVKGSKATEAKVTVDFANAPRGTRVKTDPQSTAAVDLSVGYQMLPGAP